MTVTVGQIIRIWLDAEIRNSFMISIIYDYNGMYIGDNIIINNNEHAMNYVGNYVYIYDADSVPNNIEIGVGPGLRRTGRLVTNADGSIRIANNNHFTIGQRVEI